jgi:hypothetical protein
LNLQIDSIPGGSRILASQQSSFVAAYQDRFLAHIVDSIQIVGNTGLLFIPVLSRIPGVEDQTASPDDPSSFSLEAQMK